jgi:hypothetical protein
MTLLIHTRNRLLVSLTSASLLALGLGACGPDLPETGDEGSSTGDETGGEDLPPWLSDNPNADNHDSGDDDDNEEEDDADDGDVDPADDDDADDADDDDDAEDLIEEADIIHVDGDTLYALSRLSGLSVIAIGDPNDLRVVGHHRVSGEPFEMYVEDGRAFVMYSSFGHYVHDTEANGWRWVETSRILALDARQPSAIKVEGEYDLPGRIDDSRRIDDRLYLVSYENGYCWKCGITPNTTVTSLNISDVSNMVLVDQLTFEGNPNSYGGGRRSVSSTADRMYLAGVEYDWGSDQASTIDVVDVSDPSGHLTAGDSVNVAGAITSRWQMNEHEGVLRVISQPNPWDRGKAPVIETFTIESTQNVVPLGSLAMQIPEGETLRSVRFDGTRGYAITAEQQDPLFTIDLADPAKPVQVGELEMPGWVYHMEPRGDRLIGIGYDAAHPDGAINVSLFDVSDLAKPKLLQRVHFGGDWAQFAEDQNRIHKALTIDEEREVMLVPFGGWIWDDKQDGSEGWPYYRSGVQLIDIGGDTLKLRGMAESRGQARRAFFHGETMMSVGDESVQSFDIGDRDAPVQLDYAGLAVNVSKSVRVGNNLARLSTDWWTSTVRLDLVPLAEAESATPIGELDLRAALGNSPDEAGWIDWYDSSLFTHGDAVYVTLRREIYDEDSYKTELLLFTIDVADPAKPRIVHKLILPQERSWWGGGSRLGYLSMESHRSIVKSGHYLVVNQVASEWNEAEGAVMFGQFEFVDLSDPFAPVHAATIDRPKAAGLGSLLQTANDEVYSWRMEKVGNGEKVAFYAEQFDLTGAKPALLPRVNTPGALVALDSATGRALTVDFQNELRPDLKNEACYEHPRFADYEWDTDTCRLMHVLPRLVHLNGASATLLGGLDLLPNDRLDRIVVAGGRVFARTSFDQRFDWEEDDRQVRDDARWSSPLPAQEVAVITGLEAGALHFASRSKIGGYDITASHGGGTGPRLFVAEDQGLIILDATDPVTPTVRREGLYGYWFSDVQVIDNAAYVALGERGMQRITLD